MLTVCCCSPRACTDCSRHPHHSSFPLPEPRSQVAGYSGLLLGGPVILYEAIAFVVPGLTRSERRFLAPIVFGSSVLFYGGIAFSYYVMAPAALNFFISYAEGVVESLWSIDQYFEFVLILMFSTGVSFQVGGRGRQGRKGKTGVEGEGGRRRNVGEHLVRMDSFYDCYEHLHGWGDLNGFKPQNAYVL